MYHDNPDKGNSGIKEKAFQRMVEFLIEIPKFLEFFIEILKAEKPTPKLTKVSLRIIGLITTSTSGDLMQKLLELKTEKYIRAFLDSSLKFYRIDAAWILSNLFAGPSELVGKLLQKHKLITSLLNG